VPSLACSVPHCGHIITLSMTLLNIRLLHAGHLIEAILVTAFTSS
jgi:hypothetical protein